MRRPRRLVNEINVVPYIDVMLVLLVIFMVAAPMMPSGSVDLPSVGKATQIQQAPIEIVIRSKGQLQLRHDNTQQNVEEDELIEKIQAIRADQPDRSVLIAADKNIRYENVMKIMDLLQSAQISKIGLMVQSKP